MIAKRIGTLATLLFGAASFTGCFGSPSPLAPGLKGSVGLPHQGVLTEAAQLPTSGPGFRRFRPFGSRNFGTPALVSAVEHAGQAVSRHAPNSPPLIVGDLSARWGGKISGHSSHRSGRDVDLLFYATTLDAIPVVSPGFVHFGADGLARLPDGRHIALDVHRNWLVTRALLTEPSVEVLWMFVSRDVEAFLVDHARALGEPTELLLKAERVLHQPRDSANHDDHFHVRIACSAEERAAGCEGGGPEWPWFRPQTPAPAPPTVIPWDYGEEPSSTVSN